MKTVYRVLISARTRKEAEKILETLVFKQLSAGGLITSGKSLYWWKRRVTRKTYFNLSTFTVSSCRTRLIKAVQTIHSDKVPIIAFFKVEYANPEFIQWVRENTKV